MKNSFKQVISLIVCITCMTVFSGCSLFAPKMQNVSVITSENDAQIFINGNLVGVGSAMTTVPRNQDVGIMAKKEGYYPSMRTIGTTLSTTGILDVIGGCIFLIPFFGLLAPGAWTLSSNNVTLMMSKEQ
ncbi:MAG: hypothetical protein JW938_04585 [Candidatus Omnitrophica bacterium]|nr:hypothetical protein [Candidatus Omnitrophota bacterium]